MLSSPATAGAPQAQTLARSPIAVTQGGAAVSAVNAVVNVLINPLGLLTQYDVEYGTTTEYGSTSAVTTVSGNSGAASFNVAVPSLTSSTVYHYRVVATNAFGTTDGADETFATWPVQIPFLSHGVVSKNNIKSTPTGPHAGEEPVGWVMVIHGGGWQSVGRTAVASENNTVDYVNDLGWAADNVDYRKGEHSLPDVLAAYDALRKRIGDDTPICLIGHSAGGNLALLVAEYRKTVDCVISEAGPTDLVKFASQSAYTSTATTEAGISPAWAFEQYMVTSFGVDPSILRQWSPIHRAGKVRADVLFGQSTHDALVPRQQMADLRKAMRAAGAAGTIKTKLLAGATTARGATANFTHASVTKTAGASWLRSERRLLAKVAKRA